MNINQEDEDVLVEVQTRRCRWSWPVVEPLMILFIASQFPMSSIVDQFQVVKVAEMMGREYENLSAALNSTDECNLNKSDPTYLARQAIQAEATNWTMYSSLLSFLPSIISPIVLGSLADKYGRRFLFILPCIGSIFAVSVYMVTIYFDLPIWVLLFAQLEYCLGGTGVIIAGSCAYIADTVPPNKRALRMTVIDSVSTINGALANLFVGYWIRDQGFFNPLIFVICGKFLALLYAIFLIPESLKRDDSVTRPRRRPTFKDSMSAINLCLYDNGTGRKWKINILFACVAVANLASAASVMTMYQMNSPLCWDSVQIAYYAFIAVSVQCTLMLMMSAVPHRWLSAEWKVVLSRGSLIGGNIYTVFVMTSFMMYLAPIISCFSFLATPMIRYILSSLVSAEENASIFAVMSMVHQVTTLLNSLISNELYKKTLMIYNGAILFMVASFCAACSLALMLVYIWRKNREQRSEGYFVQHDEDTEPHVENIQS